MEKSPLVVLPDGVTAPVDRFLDVPDGQLVSSFESASPPPTGDRSLMHIYDIMQRVVLQEDVQIKRRLEDDFAYFSGMGQGSNVTLGSSDSADSAATHDCEARFLNNFLHLANRAHFRVLNVGELEAAFADDFLFTLPVTVNYDAMDPGLLSRYWESRPEAAAASRLPEPLSDRAIILHRGVDMVTVEDQFIQQKIDCLISFYILQPLWTALISVARVFGADKELQEKAPPGLGDSPYVQPDASDTGKQSSSGSESPVKSSEDLAESSQRAGPRHNWMLDRQTFRTVFPNGKAVLKQLFKPIALQEVCLRDIILLYRPAMAKDGEEPKDVPLWKRGGQVEGMDREMLKQTMVLKRFRSVPLADLEMMLPDKTVYIPPNQYVSVGITVISGLVALLTTFLQSESMGVIFSGNLLKALGGILLSRAGQVAMQLQAEKASVSQQMTQMMYEKTLAAQQAVLSGLTDEVTRQRVRELFVAYCVLEQAKKALATEDLATAYAEYLSKTFDANVEMDGEHTLRTLRTWGLVKQATDGAWLAIPAERAEEALGRVWNDLYTYKPGDSPDDWQTSTTTNGVVAAAGSSSRATAILRPPGGTQAAGFGGNRRASRRTHMAQLHVSGPARLAACAASTLRSPRAYGPRFL
ncbi:CGL64B [Auxenochlorella protothecoides x Auxenochlorella symbiontica]